jgi:inhibitor of KinA
LSDFKLQFKIYGNSSILIEWPKIISEDVLKNMLNFKDFLEKNYIKQNIHILSAYNSLLVSYNIGINNIYDEISYIKSWYLSFEGSNLNTTKLWKIPVCYDLDFGLDLEDISVQNKLSVAEIVKDHTSVKYRLYFVGFLPGFLYLGGLSETLHIPRKSVPRLHVDKGSVGIGGTQTGIYPNNSPGGWNIIGKTPINLFDSKVQNPCFAQCGDQIQFYSISKAEFAKLTTNIKSNSYTLENTIVHD